MTTRATLSQGPKTLPEFQSQREILKNQANAQRMTTQNALNRRFAAMGALNSGEAAKMLTQANQGITDAENAAAGQLAFQEAQQIGQQQEADAQRAFQQGVIDVDNEFKDRAQTLDERTKLDSLDLARKQFQQESLTQAFNAALAHAEASDQATFAKQLQNYLNMFSRFTGGAGAGGSAAAIPGQPAPTSAIPGRGGVAIGGVLPDPGLSPATAAAPQMEYTEIGGKRYGKPAGSNQPWRRV